ncbi:MAG: hypothetical protein KDC98_12845 [Planctomycetes bacterium]|nr:hypothetical protein [Planctomycetota bacterium]
MDRAVGRYRNRRAALTHTGLAVERVGLPRAEDAGSWPPIGAWGDVGGRVWTTALAVLTLEAPFRYAKLK